MMRETKQIMVIIFVIALFSPLLGMIGHSETAGADGGTLQCNTNLFLIPQSGEVGGGNVHWRVTGETASDLRRALINSVGDGEGELTEEHLNEYLQTNRMLESYLQRGGTLENYRKTSLHPEYEFKPQRDIDPEDYIDYHGVKITRSSLTTDDIFDSTVGLFGSTADDTSTIEIKFATSFNERPGTQEYELNMADHRVTTAIFDSIIIPVEEVLVDENATEMPEEFQLEHENLLVKDGEVQAVFVILDSEGDLKEIRDPQGDISEGGFVDTEIIDWSPGDTVKVLYAYGLEWAGTSELSHWTFIVGTHSYYSPDIDGGTIYLIRTPAGNILRYSVEYQGYDEPTATIKWKQFNMLENPQILFVIAMVASYLTVKIPMWEFKKYRNVFHPSRRSRAKKDKLTHLSARIMSVMIIVFYLFPSLGPLYIGGIYLILIGVGLIATSGLIAKWFYKKETKQIPKEYIKPPKRKTKVKKQRCTSCDNIFTIPKNKNLFMVTCPSCGEKQRKLKEGYNYLFLEKEGDQVFSIFKDAVEQGSPGLIVTTKIPSKIREKFSLEEVDIKWLSDHGSSQHDVLDPTRLEFDILRSVSNFSKENEQGVILLDGLEYLIVENKFEKVSKFLKKTTDVCSLNATKYMVHLNPTSISKAELSILKKEFDHTEDLR
ncbi:MAG: DUF835 domain-containing protein [Thermoplasmata archaeon]